MKTKPLTHSAHYFLGNPKTLTAAKFSPYVNGPNVSLFLSQLEKQVGHKGARLTSSGSQALFQILKLMNLKSSDEVILPTYVCKEVLSQVVLVGATPVLSDIGTGWNVTPREIERKITKRTKALIIPPIFGIPLDFSKFRFSPKIAVISDLCQCFDLALSPKYLGDFSFFSFHPTKCLSGVGGAYFVLNRKFSNSGATDHLPPCEFPEPFGFILNENLRSYSKVQKHRRKLAEIYFKSLPSEATRTLKALNSTFFRFPVEIDGLKFDSLARLFLKQGIVVRRGVDSLLHRDLGMKDREFPNAIETFNSTLSLPIHAGITIQDAKRVASTYLQIVP